jgi:hypothetical protein
MSPAREASKNLDLFSQRVELAPAKILIGTGG